MRRDEDPANDYLGPKISEKRSTWSVCRSHPQPIILERPAGPCQLCLYPETWDRWVSMIRVGLT